jgi:hypothetical protein
MPLQEQILMSHLEAFGMLFSMYWYFVIQFALQHLWTFSCLLICSNWTEQSGHRAVNIESWIVRQLVRKLYAFSETRLITTLKTSRQLAFILRLMNPVHNLAMCYFKFGLNIKILLSNNFPNKFSNYLWTLPRLLRVSFSVIPFSITLKIYYKE